MAINIAALADVESPDARFYAFVRVVIGLVALAAACRYAIKATAYDDTLFEPWHAGAMLVWVLLAIPVVIGWQARLAAIAAALTGAVMVVAGAEFFNNNHMYLTTVCMGLVAFSDCERFYAVRPRAGLPDVWPRWLMRIQLSVVYGYAGLQKVNSEFLSGDALNAYMSMAVGPLAPVAHALSGTAIVQPMAYTVVIVEIGMALLVWSKRTRAIVFGIALPLHICMLLVPYNGIEFIGVVLFAILTFTLLSAWVDAAPGARLVVWDDTCSFCRRFVGAAQRVDAWGALRWQGSSSPASYAGTGVTAEAASHAMQLIEPDGRIHSGFGAVRGILAVLPGSFLIAPWLALPPVARLGEAAYRHVAARRTCAIDDEAPQAKAA
jgi:predicted DCC family thiol-disulfide oxidoreductase YuxK